MSVTAQELQNLFAHPSIRNFNSFSQQVFSQLARCHTAASGMHTYSCDNTECKNVHYQYHSCGNRHCMFCGMFRREQWMEDEQQSLLPTTYYHVVFTIPHELNALVMGNRIDLFKLLFEAAHQALLTLGKDPQYLAGQPGVTSVLHTWGQQLSFHPHVHCIVSGGGVDKNNRWIPAKRSNCKFLFPVGALMKLYRGYFLCELKKYFQRGLLKCGGIDVQALINLLYLKKWNVYAKAPFAGPQQVIQYLGLYTNKVAISKSRIVDMNESHVTFRYKDYADGSKHKLMTLSKEEFLRRYEQHILPRRFVKIRHAGYLRNQCKTKRMNEIRSSMKLPPLPSKIKVPVSIRVLEKFNVDIVQCTKCKTGRMILTAAARRKSFKLIELRNKDDPDIAKV